MTIGEFSVITGISTYTLRYYEKKGLLRVSRDNAQRQDYSEDDIEWVKFIQRLKDTGMLLRPLGGWKKKENRSMAAALLIMKIGRFGCKYGESGEEIHFEGFYKIRFIVFFVWVKLWVMSYALGRVLPWMRRR